MNQTTKKLLAFIGKQSNIHKKIISNKQKKLRNQQKKIS